MRFPSPLGCSLVHGQDSTSPIFSSDDRKVTVNTLLFCLFLNFSQVPRFIHLGCRPINRNYPPLILGPTHTVPGVGVLRVEDLYVNRGAISGYCL